MLRRGSETATSTSKKPPRRHKTALEAAQWPRRHPIQPKGVPKRTPPDGPKEAKSLTTSASSQILTNSMVQCPEHFQMAQSGSKTSRDSVQTGKDDRKVVSKRHPEGWRWPTKGRKTPRGRPPRANSGPSGTLPGHSQTPPGNYLGTKSHEDTKSDSKRPPERTQDQDSSGPPPGPSQTLPGSYCGTNISIVELHRAANFNAHAWTHLLQHAIGIRRKRRRSHALA